MSADSIASLLLGAHLASTLFMTGLIWFVQIVHYPLFSRVGPANFAEYQRRHMGLTAWIVGPPMIVEGLSAALLLWAPPAGIARPLLVTGFALLVVIWGSTAFLQVPCHDRLRRAFDANVHRRLVRSNWIRTVGWTARALLVSWVAA